MAGTINFLYLSANNFIEAYARLGKTWAETSLLCQDWIIAILRKRLLKQAVRGEEPKSEIVAIPNKYKNTLNDLMDSSNVESLEAPRSKSAPISARPDLEKDHLDKDGKDQRGEEDRQGGKKRQVVKKDTNLQTNVCYQ